MGPGEELLPQPLGDRPGLGEEGEHGVLEALLQGGLGHRRQGHEGAVGPERSVGGEHVLMGIEVRQVPEGLHEEDQAGAGAGESEGVGLEETSRGDAAELAQPRPVAAEERSQEPRDGEDVLPVGHGLEEMLFDPLALGAAADTRREALGGWPLAEPLSPNAFRLFPSSSS